MAEAKPATSDAAIAAFVSRWAKVAASEKTTAQSFLHELCNLLAVERPQTVARIANQFFHAKESNIAEIIETLISLGRVRTGDQPGMFVR